MKLEGITEGKLYKIPEVATIFGYTRQTIYSLIKLGDLKAINKEGHNMRILGKDLLDYFKK